MPSLTIKNIPEELYLKLKHTAEQRHRSINSEVIICLEQSLLPRKVSPEDRLKEIHALRARIPANAITAEDIQQTIDEGRP